ncbi:hypothetical protein [Streptomyces sp. NPDC058457]
MGGIGVALPCLGVLAGTVLGGLAGSVLGGLATIGYAAYQG